MAHLRHRLTLKWLQDWANKKGFIVERVGKTYEWYRENDHSIVGVCPTLIETYAELLHERILALLP